MRMFLRIAAATSMILFTVSLDASANLVVKVVAVNPSKTQAQKVSVKTFLPKEIKPEDVLDRGDLEITYDTQQGSYYVSGEYDLEIGQTIERSVELRDIWLITAADMETIRTESDKIVGLLKNTDLAERVNFLKNSIDSKLNQIIEAQKNTPTNPERHISDYRDNLRILESIKADLAMQRNLLSQFRPVPAAAIWKVVLFIIVFLGVLGGAFYLIWQRQSKTVMQDSSFNVPPGDEPSATPTKHEATEEKKNFGNVKDLLDKT